MNLSPKQRRILAEVRAAGPNGYKPQGEDPWQTLSSLVVRGLIRCEVRPADLCRYYYFPST